MKKTITIFLVLLCVFLEFILVFLSFLLGKTFATPNFQTWTLRGETNVIRIYTKGSKYKDVIEKATEKYNEIAPIFAVTETVKNADVSCYDFEEAMKDGMGTLGITYKEGRIGFNTYLLANDDEDVVLSVCLHELGHAIGLDHNNEKNSIMNSQYNPTEFSKSDIGRIEYIYHQNFHFSKEINIKE